MVRELGTAARSIGALADELRRGMYLFIRRSPGAVSRDEAARAVGISAKLAAFHLDKLVDEGLLQAHYARLPGRSGPGAGRSSKLYEPTDRTFDVSLPPRSYEFVSRLLLATLQGKKDGESPETAARRVGHAAGTEAGASAGAKSVEEILTELGFEPRHEEEIVLLANCPFHSLAQVEPELVCGLNEAFIAGVLEGADATTKRAFLDPEPGRCCVTLEEAGQAS